jgi:hypothetical protein
MKNIYLIETDKPSRLLLSKRGNLQFLKDNSSTNSNNHFIGTYQNIYITNDEEIKEGDYVYHNSGYVSIVLGFNLDAIKLTDSQRWSKDCKKIILTTDDQLIQDGVQAIDDEFLEWFVKNPNCEKVEVTYDKDAFPYGVETSKEYGWYKIIIPQETLSYTEAAKKDERIFNSTMMKQETIDEVNDNRKNLYFKKQVMNPYAVEEYSHTAYEKGFIEVYEESNKYQAERMYSESEVIILLNKFGSKVYGDYTRNTTMEKFCDKWFEQNKKK